MADQEMQGQQQGENPEHTKHSKQFNLMYKRKQLLRSIRDADRETQGAVIHQVKERAQQLYKEASRANDMTLDETHILMMS